VWDEGVGGGGEDGTASTTRLQCVMKGGRGGGRGRERARERAREN
jgi:hypothetical protein